MSLGYSGWRSHLVEALAPTYDKLRHYSNKVFLEIYPLTRAEYRQRSLARRASYAYLTQTIEVCLVGCAIAGSLAITRLSSPRLPPVSVRRSRNSGVSSRQPNGDTMSDIFFRAGQLHVVPSNLASDLAGLALLRNKANHENDIVDSNLLLYDRLLQLLSVGLATREAFKALTVQEDVLNRPPEVIVDSLYVRTYLDRRWRDSAKGTLALRRLDREIDPPRYVISYKEANSFLELVRKVQSTGD